MEPKLNKLNVTFQKREKQGKRIDNDLNGQFWYPGDRTQLTLLFIEQPKDTFRNNWTFMYALKRAELLHSSH